MLTMSIKVFSMSSFFAASETDADSAASAMPSTQFEVNSFEYSLLKAVFTVPDVASNRVFTLASYTDTAALREPEAALDFIVAIKSPTPVCAVTSTVVV